MLKVKRLLTSYMKERTGQEVTDDEDKVAECSGDEEGEVVSDDIKPEEAKEITRAPEPDIVVKNEHGDEESDESDEEMRELYERKKRLEQEKQSLSDAKQRKQAERQLRKLQLKQDVDNLQSEVEQLHLKYTRAVSKI